MPLKLGMLGMWHSHADGVVRQVAAHPDEFSLVALCDPDPQVVEARRKKWEPLIPGMRVLPKPQDVLNEPIDAVVVESRVYENVGLAQLALDSGRPVMLEKPAGDNLRDFRRLVDLAQRKHLHVQMIYLFRYMSAVQEMLRRAKQGECGRLYEFRARLPKVLGGYDGYVDELQRYGGGIFFEMAGHIIDLAVALLGKPKSVTPFMGHHHDVPGKFIDHGIALLGFDHAWGIIEVPALEVAPHSRRIELYGEEGAVVIPHLGSGHLANKNIQPVEVFRKGMPDWETLNLPAATLQIRDLREFAAVIAGKKAPDFTLQHDLDVQEALIQASGMSP